VQHGIGTVAENDGQQHVVVVDKEDTATITGLGTEPAFLQTGALDVWGEALTHSGRAWQKFGSLVLDDVASKSPVACVAKEKACYLDELTEPPVVLLVESAGIDQAAKNRGSTLLIAAPICGLRVLPIVADHGRAVELFT
jgi:hypothetical protein